MTLSMIRILLFSIAFICVSTASMAAEQGTRPMTDKEKEQSAKLSEIYAESMFLSSCIKYSQMYMSKDHSRFTQQSNPELYAQYVKACECYTKGVVKVATPDEIISYVKMLYGYQAGTPKMTPDRRAYFSSESFNHVATYTADEASRKKCGFVR